MQDAGPGDAAQLERRVFASALALLLVCAWPFVGDIPARYLALTRALVEERGCAIDRFHEDTPDKAFKDGHYYLAAAPGPSFAAAPAYALVYFCGGSVLAGLIAATLFAGVLPGALAFRGLFRLTGVAARAPPPTPWRLATVLALAATFVTPLATVFYASALSVACVVWSLVHGCAYRRAVEGTPAAEGPSAEGSPPEAGEPQPAAPSSASAPRAHMAWAGCLLASLVGCEYA
ncbi:MAG: hypothetical protein KDD82_19875, partial [Planctomycetes bacterium]|nr:hypothetical protein [Planctomycetota bacterium]